MSKRNFILLIVILSLAIIAVFGFLYFRQDPTTAGTGDDTNVNFLSRFNPFGSKTPANRDNTTSGEGTTDFGTDTNTQEEINNAKLKKISSIPIAGFSTFMKERLQEVQITPTTAESGTPPKKAVAPPPTEFALALRYVDRVTGNIYQTFVDKIEERKFSGTVIPKVYDAYFGNSAQSVVMRHLKTNDRTIETFVGALPKEKLGEDMVNNEVKGSFLVDDIKDISLSPDATKIFYLFNNKGTLGESAIGTIYNLADGKKTQIFDSPFTEWLSFWSSSKTVTLTTKPSGGFPGYMYTIDVDKKNLTKVLADISGLTTAMSPNGKTVLYSGASLSLSIYDMATKTSESLGVRTLPEKCVWSKTSEFVYCAVPAFVAPATYPDDWYKGVVSFSDQIWKINVLSGSANIVGDPSEIAGEDVDGIKLALDANEGYLFFVNKKDSFLWQLNLK